MSKFFFHFLLLSGEMFACYGPHLIITYCTNRLLGLLNVVFEPDPLLKLVSCIKRKCEAFKIPATLPAARVTTKLCADVNKLASVDLWHVEVENMLLIEDICWPFWTSPCFPGDFLLSNPDDEVSIHYEVRFIHMADKE